MPIDENIFGYIKRQEALYKMPAAINEKWSWNMREHILTTVLYTNSQLLNGKTEFTPVKNIIRPILNLQHRAEDIEVKDVQLYVNEADRYHLSFLVKKYHDDVFTQKYDIDSFIDELNVSRIDMGAGLSKQLNSPCPEVVHLESIAFCDQTDILSGPIGLEHYYSPDQLLDMKSKGWGNPAKGATISLEDLLTLSKEEKVDLADSTKTKTPGRYIKVYEVHGNLPKKFADPLDTSGEYETRLFICAFYQKKSNDGEQGVILYTAPETKSPFKLIKRDPIFGRAVGFGGAEELFEAQVWTNYDVIRVQGLLDATAKVILQSDDPTVTQKQKVRDMENLTVIDVAPNTSVRQIDTTPRSMALFERSIEDWENHAKDMGAAQDPLQGKAASSGTPFASVQSQIQQSSSLHEYRRGIYAKHLEEIYRDWIIPYIQKEIVKGTTFLSELSLDELQMVSEALVTNQTNDFIKKQILSGVILSSDDIDAYKQQLQTAFKKKGNKHFIEILKDEFKDTELGVKVTIAGKSKDLAGMVDKLTNVFRTIIASPYILQSPPIAALFNKIIEAAGLDPIDLSGFKVPPLPARQMREVVDYKDIEDPNEKKAMLTLAGIEPQTQTTQ